MQQPVDEAPPGNGTAGQAARARFPGWIPIRALSARHREKIARLLLELDPGDRYLRFGHHTTDGQIQRHVDALDFDRDALFGIFDRRLLLIAVAHLAFGTVFSPGKNLAEFGVSVLPRARGRGYGARLFRHAALHARNRGCGGLMIHALSENRAMLKIAHRAGASVEHTGAESEAWLSLPAPNRESLLDERVEARAAEWNYRFKVHARRLKKWVGDMKTSRFGLRVKRPENQPP